MRVRFIFVGLMDINLQIKNSLIGRAGNQKHLLYILAIWAIYTNSLYNHFESYVQFLRNGRRNPKSTKFGTFSFLELRNIPKNKIFISDRKRIMVTHIGRDSF